MLFQPHAEEVAQKINTEKVKARKEERNSALKPVKPKAAREPVLPQHKVETPEEKVTDIFLFNLSIQS